MPDSQESLLKERWVFVLSLCTIPILLVDGNYATALPIIKAEWGLTGQEAGAIYATFYFGLILSTATDYFSTRTIFLISGIWLVGANLLVAFLAEGFWSAALLRLLAGAGLSGVFATGIRMVADHAPRDRRAFSVSFFTFCYSLGVAISLFAAGWFLRYFDWRAAFALGSIGTAGGVVWASLIIPPLASPQREGGIRFELPKLPLLVWVVIGIFILHRSEVFGFRAWAVAFFSSSLTESGLVPTTALNQAASAAAAILVIASFSNLFGGWLTDRVGH
jgi:MFS family permease